MSLPAYLDATYALWAADVNQERRDLLTERLRPPRPVAPMRTLTDEELAAEADARVRAQEAEWARWGTSPEYQAQAAALRAMDPPEV